MGVAAKERINGIFPFLWSYVGSFHPFVFIQTRFPSCHPCFWRKSVHPVKLPRLKADCHGLICFFFQLSKPSLQSTISPGFITPVSFRNVSNSDLFSKPHFIYFAWVLSPSSLHRMDKTCCSFWAVQTMPQHQSVSAGFLC